MNYACGRCGAGVEASGRTRWKCRGCGAALERNAAAQVALALAIAVTASSVVFDDRLEAWGVPGFALLALQAALILAIAASARAAGRLRPVAGSRTH